MKKLLGTLAIVALASSAFAQGTVIFNNGSTTQVKQWTSKSDPTLINVAKNNGRVELVVGSASATLNNAFFKSEPNGMYAPNFSSLSAFLTANAGWTTLATAAVSTLAANGQYAGGTVTIGGIAAGANANYFVLGWTGNYATFDEALAAAMLDQSASFMGQLPVILTTTGNPSAQPPGTATPLNNTLVSMTLAPVVIPEPTSFALAGLGLAALLVFRRRN
jgi:PEP-CTERM motif